jgi:hypothetical protein
MSCPHWPQLKDQHSLLTFALHNLAEPRGFILLEMSAAADLFVFLCPQSNYLYLTTLLGI